MTMTRMKQRTHKAAAAVVLSLTALGLPACGFTGSDDDVEPPNPTEQPDAQEQLGAQDTETYSGPYDEAFLADAATLVDADVTLTAQVEEVVSPVAFTISDAVEGVTEPLLVVNFDEDTTGLNQGDPVLVTGTYREAYNVPSAEEDLRETPGAEQLAHYDGEPYLEATEVEVGEAATAAATG